MKIIRLSFEIDKDGASYYFDSPYNDEITAQDNCNYVLKRIMSMCETKTAISAMLKHFDDNKDKPVILNTGLIPVIVITNVVVYSDEQIKE
jgi:hypothetical protein